LFTENKEKGQLGKFKNDTYSFMVLPMMPEDVAFLISSAAAEIVPIILKVDA
jgi:hypothetical protein